MLRIGDKFRLTDDAVTNYGRKFRDKIFTVEKVSTSVEDHRGYDEGMDGMALYDAEEINFSVYEYEIEEV